ncbi:amino acid adenylation domain-containing protein [Streptomyces sp. NPDC001980]|uniref:amino acid adenylation domain-containing protein n=1 Tax=Streptomyces sp. NPDC001980 TaxID=3157126 RepID=UPI0033228809
MTVTLTQSDPGPGAHGPAADYPLDATVHEVFTRIAETTPDRTALVTPTASVTYGELHEASTASARALVAAGVRPGDLVAVRLGRGIAWITAYLAVLKAGAAMLPVSTREPDQRVALLLADSGAKAVIGKGLTAPAGLPVLDAGASGPRDTALPGDLRAESPAYVMYTSGSTGVPKGVVVSHRNVLRLVVNSGFARFGPDMRVLQTGAVSFDATTFEVWGPLLAGGCVVLVDDDTILDAARLGAALREHAANTLWLTAPLFSQLAGQEPGLFAPLRELFVGGDVVVGRHVAAVMAACPDLRVVNGYGPTENTTFSTLHTITEADTAGTIPIGLPPANSSAYVLDEARSPVPAGTAGELYVGGDGVALGYLNRPELTAERFLTDPFRRGGRMYRTGDLALRRADGVIEFLGRTDDQVKVRGFRIELREIEEALRGHPEVVDAVVVLRDRGPEPADRYLVGYAAATSWLDSRDLRAYLASKLSPHLVPGYLVVLDELPLTAHGKVDRAALPDAVSMPDMPEEYVPAESEAEKRLVSLWEGLLGIDTPGVLDSLLDLGVDSLGAARLSRAIADEFGRSIPVSEILGRPTIRELAAVLDGAPTETSGHVDGAPTETPGHPDGAQQRDTFALTSAQRAMYAAQRSRPETVQYNVSLLIDLAPDVDPAALERAFAEVIGTHDALRTEFTDGPDGPVQRVVPAVPFHLEQRHAPLDPVAEIRPIALDRAPLLRATLSRDADAAQLFVDAHHLILDGDSLRRVFADIDAAYHGRPVEAPTRSFADYLAWSEGEAAAARREADRSYWKDVFRSAPARPELPADRPRPALRTFAGATTRLHFGPERTARMRALAAERRTTLFPVLAAGYGAFLRTLTGSADVTLGVPTIGRGEAAFDRTVGMFVDTVCLRLDAGAETPLAALVTQAAAGIGGALVHSTCGLDELAALTGAEQIPGRTPLFDTMLALHAADLLAVDFLGTPLTLRPLFPGHTMFDLNLQVYDHPSGLRADWEYSTELFDPPTVESFKELLLATVDRLLDDPDEPVVPPSAVPAAPSAVPAFDFDF